MSPEDAMSMIGMTPTERLEWLLQQEVLVATHDKIEGLLRRYEAFLQATNIVEDELVEVFLAKDQSRAFLAKASEFGNLVFDVLNGIGQGSKFHRLLVV